ncbi:MAG TPA: SpoIIE family protein phosphatase [Thermoanaerobaculia bacterium]|nr:SpoIIE family protein phosphatase [Thermoanaerobaculia bacterium]
MRPQPQPDSSGRGVRLFIIWLTALLLIIGIEWIKPPLRRLHVPTAIFTFVEFLCWLLFIALCLYAFAVFVRWLMRALFWRVGRRLFLSYLMIGLLPFFLFAILMLTIGYMIAGVMSHAALRNERQASLGQMESQALEYGLTGAKPADALPSLEIYDTAAPSGGKLPDWLKENTFSGMVWRKDAPLLIASRQFPRADAAPRTVVFVQPIDGQWAGQLQDRTGMIVRIGRETGEVKTHGMRTTVQGKDIDFDADNGDDMQDLIVHSIGRRIIWGDLTSLNEWETGSSGGNRPLFTLIITPVSSLFQFYFGPGSDQYVHILINIIAGIAVTLLFIYMIAALFASVLIFSISRAVNRIEKGTKAVERGDFTYRIGMKPHNQLGEMAQSFDRMTESIATLLTNVAEKERLQSEIAIAASIQRNLLPKEGPQFGGVSFAAHFEPTASIGGDYYDVFNLDKSRLAVAIGDVSGHGLSTGLVMAMVKAAITTLVEEGADEVALFDRLNELVYRSTERRAFMTLAFTIFDLERGTIRHTNAGHLYPYLLRDGQPPVSIELPSLPLGVRAEIHTRTATLDLEEGDTIVYLSDGIVEAQSEQQDPFGFDQLESLLAQAKDRSPSALRDTILDAVARHSGTRPADDDRTVMVLRFDQFRSALATTPALAEPAVV